MERLDNSIQRVWKTEQEILDVIDSVCRENGLCYSLMYGTLLGAVRHHGFIPWDDDIDLIMPREDYNRLIKIWDQVSPDNYILQNKDTNADYPNSFLKIRKLHTTFLQGENERVKTYQKGIFVDIFPADRFAPTKLLKKVQFSACLLNMLLTRDYSSGDGGLVELVERIILLLPKDLKEKLRLRTERYIQKWNDNKENPYLVPVTVQSCRRVYPPDMFVDLNRGLFQGKSYPIIKDYDSVLKTVFGDYMTLPPESERTWKHHPIILDFEHDLEELEHE